MIDLRNLNHHRFTSLLCCVALSTIVATVRPLAAKNPSSPNIVLIFADDVGYGDVGCYGASKIATPNIDALAAQGRRFTDYHTASAVCSPSRYALLTGQYPFRVDLYHPLFLRAPLAIDPQQPTIASMLRQHGYKTACIGKWHLGFGTEAPDWNGDLKPGPLEVGFDYYFGVPVVNSHPPFVWVENHRVVGLDPNDPFVFGQKAETTPYPEKRKLEAIGGARAAHALYDDRQVGTRIAAEAVEYIDQHADERFFLYLATTNIHHPFTPAPRFDGTSQAGRYGDFMHELDWIVGRVQNALDENGITDETLIIFASDNGGMLNEGGQDAWRAGHALNGDLLGFKFGAWEGGHRVPFIVRWDGHVPAGTVSDQLLCSVDLFATLGSVVGHKLDDLEAPDSLDALPMWTSESQKAVRTSAVLAANRPSHLSFRQGDWMYIPAQGSGGFGGPRGGPGAIALSGRSNSDITAAGRLKRDAPPAQLYNLRRDLGQTTNVIREHPEVARQLSQALQRAIAAPGTRPGLNPPGTASP